MIRSWLIDLMERGYREHGRLGDIPPYVEDTGEVNWLVGDAIEMEVPTPVSRGANRIAVVAVGASVAVSAVASHDPKESQCARSAAG